MTGTYIGVSVETREELKRIGKKGETYDAIVSHLLALYKEINMCGGDE